MISKTFRQCFLATALLFGGAAHAAVLEYGAILNGAQEVPPVATPGNGVALVLFDDVTKEFVWTLKFADLLAPVTVAHVHDAPAGSNGLPEFSIAGGLVDGTGKTEGIFAGLQILSAAQELSLRAGNLYFNLHTAAAPGGEIRGQILPGSVTVVPLPGALVLLGSAVGGLAMVRRRA